MQSESYGRICSREHCEWLVELLTSTKGDIVWGGLHDVEKRYVAPTLLTSVEDSDPVMHEEVGVCPLVLTSFVQQSPAARPKRPWHELVL